MGRRAAATAFLAVTGCSFGGDDAQRFSERGVTFEVPTAWSVSGFSETVTPRRLVAASYPVTRADVEGDCGGHTAVQRMPRDGAYVVLIDYGGPLGSEPLNRLPVTLVDGRLAEFACFGRSYVFTFVVNGRRLQAHIAVGDEANADVGAQALWILNSMRVQ